MSNIKIFGLGGLGEIGKNLYVVEVDKSIFVLEAGIKNPPLEMFGVDAIIPDISYLKENKARIQGIFLSHGRDDKIGAIPLILKDLNTNVYSSSFTIEILKDSLDEDEIKLFSKRLKIINENIKLKFGNVTVTLFRTTQRIHDTLISEQHRVGK